MLLSLLLAYILTFCLYRDMSIRSGVPVEMKRSLVHFHANNVSQQGQKIFEGKILESVDDNSVMAFACVSKQLRRVWR